MVGGGEAAVTAKASVPIRVPADAYAVLVRLQEEFRAEHDGAVITLQELAARGIFLLADRKPVRP